MKNDRIFLKCSICGNIIGVIEDGGPRVVCCGKEMELLAPNTVDAAKEKHVPVATRENGEIKVQIGSVLHPMIEAHHILWIVLAGEGWTQRVSLNVGSDPVASFCVKDDGDVTVYAYCNLHGLWASEI